MTYDENLKHLLRIALREDIGSGDVTTKAFVGKNIRKKAHIIIREKAILCGIDAVKTIYQLIDKRVKVIAHRRGGEWCNKGDYICHIEGPVQAILKGERLALNFLSHLSGVSNTTYAYVQQVKGTKTKILDTRKTTPGYRILEKDAVRKGGGYNHRMGLYDQVLIKDNHFELFGERLETIDLVKKIRDVRKKIPKGMKVEIEADTIEQVALIVPAHPDIILLDNMDARTMRAAIDIIKRENRRSKKKILSEASGGITLKNVRRIARLGVDRISVGALTHSARGIDYSLEME